MITDSSVLGLRLYSTAPPAAWLQPTLVIAVGSGVSSSGDRHSASSEGIRDGAAKGKGKSGQMGKEKVKNKTGGVNANAREVATDDGEDTLPKHTSVVGFSREVHQFNDIFGLAGLSIRAKEVSGKSTLDKSTKREANEDFVEVETEKGKEKEKEGKKLSKRQVCFYFFAEYSVKAHISSLLLLASAPPSTRASAKATREGKDQALRERWTGLIIFANVGRIR